MNIIQQPDMLSLSMNLKNFIIGSSRQTTFTLKAGDKELVSQVYAPDENGVMEIDIHEIVHSFLSYSLKDIGEVYQQTNRHQFPDTEFPHLAAECKAGHLLFSGVPDLLCCGCRYSQTPRILY